MCKREEILEKEPAKIFIGTAGNIRPFTWDRIAQDFKKKEELREEYNGGRFYVGMGSESR